MKKTMCVVFALGLIVLSLDLFRPKATNNILIGKWGYSGERFIFQPDGTVEFHTDWMTFSNAADAIFGLNQRIIISGSGEKRTTSRRLGQLNIFLWENTRPTIVENAYA